MPTLDERLDNAEKMMYSEFWGFREYLDAIRNEEGHDNPLTWLDCLADNGETELFNLELDRFLRSPDIDESDRKILILCGHLDCSPQELDRIGDGPYGYGDEYKFGRASYAILTDDEANSAWDESLESYLEECILSELDGIARTYFDTERWKNDARMDGRGHSLSSYDGHEYEFNYCGTWYYVYRTN